MYRSTRSSLLFLTLLVTTAALVLGQGTPISAPKNKYSPADDVKVGQEAAAEVRKQMPLLPENGDADNYVEHVGQVLAAAIPQEFNHSEFHYDFSVVNASDINAFALPGGPMFVNRGMIEAAHSEGEMAGVMAHEISHVALRHGTAQATKSQSAGIQLGAIGGAILGAIIGGNAGEAVAQGTQLGLGTYLLKFSREYETQADLLGSHILAKAGYDPMDLARMFQTIEQQGGPGGPEWLSSHPNPGNRFERISEEAKKLMVTGSRNEQPAEFTKVKEELKNMSPAPTSEEIAKGRTSGGPKYPDNARIGGDVQQPSDRYRNVELSGLFKISVPENWKEFREGSSVTFAPDGAYGNEQGQPVFTHGAIVAVMEAPSQDLAMLSDQYIAGVLKGNSYLKAEGAKYQQERVGGHMALRRRLSGKSPITNRQEIVDVHTTLTNRGRFFSIVQVVPGNEQKPYAKAFQQMVKSAMFTD